MRAGKQQEDPRRLDGIMMALLCPSCDICLLHSALPVLSGVTMSAEFTPAAKLQEGERFDLFSALSQAIQYARRHSIPQKTSNIVSYMLMFNLCILGALFFQRNR